MRVKHVPTPPTTEQAAALSRIEETQAAVPLVPGRADDCCARLQARVGFTSRDVSRTWLTFLRGLGYAEETSDGFRRTRRSVTPEATRRGLVDGLVGADRLADAATSEPLTAARAFEAVAESVPRWERTRTDDWESVWQERTDRLLGWFHAFDLIEPVTDESVSESVGSDSGPTAESDDGAATGRPETRYRATETLTRLAES